MTDMDTMSVEEQLDAWLDAALDDLDTEPQNLDHAGKLLGAMKGVDRRRAEITAVATARIQAIRDWHAEAMEPLDARRAHLEALISGWALAEWTRTKRKTWEVPEGKIMVRALRPRMEVDARVEIDGDLLDRVASVIPAAVKVERSVLVSQVKDDDVWRIVSGDPIPDYPADVGYEARQVVAVTDAVRTIVPGVVALVPVDGIAGQKATVKPS